MTKNNTSKYIIISAIVIVTMALFFIFCSKKKVENKYLILYNESLGKISKKYKMHLGDIFSITFHHSVNNTDVTDFYKFDKKGNIYVYETKYYSFGAGVPTELNENQTIIYNDDGSMSIKNINKKIDTLSYYISSLYDHKLKINDGNEISLWDVVGKETKITLYIGS